MNYLDLVEELVGNRGAWWESMRVTAVSSFLLHSWRPCLITHTWVRKMGLESSVQLEYQRLLSHGSQLQPQRGSRVWVGPL